MRLIRLAALALFTASLVATPSLAITPALVED